MVRNGILLFLSFVCSWANSDLIRDPSGECAGSD
jgi:hypothetical protein